MRDDPKNTKPEERPGSLSQPPTPTNDAIDKRNEEDARNWYDGNVERARRAAGGSKEPPLHLKNVSATDREALFRAIMQTK